MNRILIRLTFLCISAISHICYADGNPKEGARVFAEECGDCHSSIPGKNKRGPSLVGVMGRKSGSVPDFSGYSDAMKQMTWAWSTEKLDTYIATPKKVVPGGRMKYDGLADAKARSDVIAYLNSLKN
jgi:cytochrome c